MKSISPDTCLVCKGHTPKRRVGHVFVGYSVVCQECMDKIGFCGECGEFKPVEKCTNGFLMCSECIEKDMEAA